MAIPSNILKKAQRLYNFARKLNYSHASAIGVCANVMAESGFDEHKTEVGGGGGYGLGQWTPKQNLYNQGKTLGYTTSQCETFDVQCDILLRGDETGQWLNKAYKYDPLVKSPLKLSEFKKITNIDSATVNYMAHWERPAYDPNINHKERRKKYAKEFDEKLNKGDYPDPGPEPEKPPEPTPEPDLSQLLNIFDRFTEKIDKELKKILTIDMYNYGNNNNFGNNYIKVIKQLDNMYKIKPTINFSNLINEIFKSGKKTLNDILSGYVPFPDPEEPPPPKPDPDFKKYFPVNYNESGVNFWYPPYDSSLKKNMDYGVRTNGKFHSGYDIGGGGKEHKIYSVAEGKVVRVDVLKGYGTCIQIKHQKDRYYSFYAHLKANSNVVNVGDTVKAGQHIATMGNTGGNYAIHLHFELSPNGGIGGGKVNTIDPKPYLEITGNNKTNLPAPN